MSDTSWVDTLGDYPPLKRQPMKCGDCGKDLILRHLCDVQDDGPIEAIEGWFMDVGYAPDRGFWQMAAGIIEALQAEGYAIVKEPK